MCRLLGVVSSETTDYGFSLCHAPRSLAHLSREHADGWGLAVFSSTRGWDVHKHPACARDDERFDALAATARGEVLVAHIRKRTVGPVGIDNTHPFRAGRWVFAHNGTVQDVAFLEARTSTSRRGAVQGATDSERLFAYLLTAIDRVEGRADDAVDAALAEATAELRSRADLGSTNFFLSDGRSLYAHRFGRTLHVLERGQRDGVRRSRASSETGAVVSTPWSARRVAILIASEAMTDEPWDELPDATLIRVDGGAWPRWSFVVAGVAVSEARGRAEHSSRADPEPVGAEARAR